MKWIGMVAAGTIAVFACLLLCTPALADYNFDGFPVETRVNGAIYGGVFIGYEPWAGTTTLTGNFDVPDGDVKWARLYTGVWGGTEDYEGWVNVTFNGVYDRNGLGPIHLQGESDTNPNVWCSTHGKYWIWYNVTDLVNAGSVNTATTTKINATVGSFDGRVYGIVLVVVYEGGDNPKDIQYWINDGNDALHYAYATWPPVAHDTGTTYFNGTVNEDIVSNANLTMVHLTAYEPSCDSCLRFNEHELDTSMVDSNTFELNTWDVTDYVASSENNAWYTRGDDSYINVANAILVLERGAVGKPDLTITAIKPYHYEWCEEYELPKGDPWFNLTNYVNVTVKNNGTGAAGSFEVKLYADEELIGSETLKNLPAGGVTDVRFEWMPEGEDPLSWTDTAEGAVLAHADTSKTYTLKAVVDEDEEVLEENEGNNVATRQQKVVWNGFASDEPLKNYAHGNVKGGIIYTTGDGQYQGIGSAGTEYGTYYDINYDLAIPGSAKVARLYIYYTWAQPSYKAPKIGVTLKTPSDGTHQLNMEKSYNDIRGDFGPLRYAWGTYAYDITEYVKESGTYIVRVTNLNDGSDSDFATKYAFAAPAILTAYENASMSERAYWINEGADILIGGRRSDTGFLDLEECKNTALFPGSIDLSEVKKATLGVVSPWGGEAWVSDVGNVLYFNDAELGKDVYCGYYSPCSEEMGGISMYIGASNAQVGINATDVADYLKDYDNEVIQGDDGDCMMPANAMLIVEYKPEPTISIYTDKTRYTTGEKMHLGLDVKNPLDSAQRVSLNIYLEMPTSGTFTLIDRTVTLPPGLDYSNPDFMVFRLPSIPAGTYTWHAILDDPVTGEIICEDTAPWEFVLKGASTEDVTEALEQATVVIDFEK